MGRLRDRPRMGACAIRGELKSIESGRVEWRFQCSEDMQVRDLCTELAKKTLKKTVPCGAPDRALLVAVENSHMVVQEDSKTLSVRIREIEFAPAYGGSEEEDMLAPSFCMLTRVRQRVRACGACKKRVGVYQRKRDVLIPRDVNIICEECHKEFHFGKDGQPLYGGEYSIWIDTRQNQ